MPNNSQHGGLAALLAKRHKSQQSSQNNHQPTGLAGLLAKGNIQRGNKDSGLNSILAKVENQRKQSTKVEPQRAKYSEPSGKLKQMIQKSRVRRDSNKPAVVKPEIRNTVKRRYEELLSPHESNYKVLTDSTNAESALTQQIFDHGSKKRKCVGNTTGNIDIFEYLTNGASLLGVKVRKNFSKPSPDERTKAVNGITKGVADVELEQKGSKKDNKAVHATKPKTKINVGKELAQKAQKPNLSFIMIGHVDSGKSTMIGRLLYDLHIVNSRTMHKLTKESESIGKASFSLAWIMDQTPEERSRGVTVDICETQFETDTTRFTVIDSPGHKDYVPQMINGVTQADLAVVIVDITSFEAGFSENGQTREHLTIAKSLGIEKCIVCINKMDAVDWERPDFNNVVDQLTDFLVNKLHFKASDLIFIPTSGYEGDNVVSKSKKCGWYQGKPLVPLLEEASKQLSHQFDNQKPLIMTVNDLEPGSRDDMLTVSGRINSGSVQPGETVIISPSGSSGLVDSIIVSSSVTGSFKSEKHASKLAIEGEFVSLKLRKVSDSEDIRIGDLATKAGEKLQLPVSKLFTCEISCFTLERPLLVGTPFVLFRGNISIPCRLKQIEHIVTASGKKHKKRRHMASNDSGVIHVEVLDRAVPVLTFEEAGKLGRVVIRREGKTIAAGRVISSD